MKIYSRTLYLLVRAGGFALWLASRAGAAEPGRLDLAGEWRFALDPASAQRQTADGIRGDYATNLPPGDGIAQRWFNLALTNRIRLPGILQAQGYGDDISVDTPWVLTLGDAWWKLQPAALRDHFSQPGHVEVPFLAQPPRHYLGVAWYQRDLTIPPGWQGRHFTLSLERAHWQTTVWIDDKAYPPNDSLVAPHITDLGLLAPGPHRLSIRVDNRTQFPAAGHLVDGHSVSDSLGATWNGIVGRIELIATSPVWIDDAQAFPNVTNKSALIKVKIGNATGKSGQGVVSIWNGPTKKSSIPDQALRVQWDASESQPEPELPAELLDSSRSPVSQHGKVEIALSLGQNAVLWDEFHPALQRVHIELKGDAIDDSRDITFGLRDISHDDKTLLINGASANLRLTHFGGDFALTGAPAMDVASWKKIIQVCKDYGLNGIRFHSWFPPEAAFAAGDEMGFYYQPECGMWNDFGTPAMRQRLYDETDRVLQSFGNHPSFVLFSPSNEPRNYQRVTPQWAEAEYKKDNRRLYSAGTGWGDPSQVVNAQYAVLVGYGGGQLRGTAGWFGGDYRRGLETVHIPVLGHEVGQWCAYPDFDVIQEFTGYLRPGNYDIFKYIAEQEGVLDQNHALALASGRFQVAAYKEEIEANLRTPGMSGYQMLDLHDYLGQGTALIGVVDAFWQPKSYVTAAQFRRFAGATVPLARLARRVFTGDQRLESDVEICHFGAQPLPAATPVWKIVDTSGRTVAGGQWDPRDIPIGKNIPLGKLSADLAKFPAPAAYQLVVGLRGTTIENDWNFWLYPASGAAPPGEVVVTSAWAEAARNLAAGGKVLFLPGAADLDPAKSPALQRSPLFWNIQMTVRPPQNPRPKFDAMLGLLCDTNSPALAEFPTDIGCDWQWTQILNGVRSVNLSAAPRSLRPIVAAIDDWNRNWRLGVIFECNVGPGRLLVSTINVSRADADAELSQLRRSLLDYMAGNRFKPSATLTPAQAFALWSEAASAIANPAPARAFDPDLNAGESTQGKAGEQEN